jgi:hypothetical protein
MVSSLIYGILDSTLVDPGYYGWSQKISENESKTKVFGIL